MAAKDVAKKHSNNKYIDIDLCFVPILYLSYTTNIEGGRKMLKSFQDVRAYNQYRSNNENYVDIKSNFSNGYILRDKYNLITDELIEKYNLIDNTGDIVDQNTGEVRKDYKRYIIKTYEGLRRIIKENLVFIVLCSGTRSLI